MQIAKNLIHEMEKNIYNINSSPVFGDVDDAVTPVSTPLIDMPEVSVPQSPQAAVDLAQAAPNNSIYDPNNNNTNDINNNDINNNDINTNDMNTNDINNNDINTNDMNTNDMNTNDMNTNDINTNDANTIDNNTIDNNTNDTNTIDTNTNDTNTNDTNTNDTNTNDTNTNIKTTTKDNNNNANHITRLRTKNWKQYKRYTEGDITAAIQSVRGGMSALQAARVFGVPSRTLYDRVKKLGFKRPVQVRCKRPTVDDETSAAFPYSAGFGHIVPPVESSTIATGSVGTNAGALAAFNNASNVVQADVDALVKMESLPPTEIPCTSSDNMAPMLPTDMPCDSSGNMLPILPPIFTSNEPLQLVMDSLTAGGINDREKIIRFMACAAAVANMYLFLNP